MAEVVVEVRGGSVVSTKAPLGIDVRIIDYDNHDEEGYIDRNECDVIDSIAIVWTKEDIFEVAMQMGCTPMGITIDRKIASCILKNLLRNHRHEHGINWKTVECYLESFR